MRRANPDGFFLPDGNSGKKKKHPSRFVDSDSDINRSDPFEYESAPIHTRPYCALLFGHPCLHLTLKTEGGGGRRLGGMGLAEAELGGGWGGGGDYGFVRGCVKVGIPSIIWRTNTCRTY